MFYIFVYKSQCKSQCYLEQTNAYSYHKQCVYVSYPVQYRMFCELIAKEFTENKTKHKRRNRRNHHDIFNRQESSAELRSNQHYKNHGNNPISNVSQHETEEQRISYEHYECRVN